MENREIERIVGETLEYYRKLKGVTRETLADDIGVSIQQLYKYERKGDCIKISRLLKICKVLDIDTMDFISTVMSRVAAKIKLDD